MSLFREEALEHRAPRLHGDVILTSSPIQAALVAIIVIVTIALIIWAVIGSYNRIETVSGELTPTGDYSKLYALRAGVVSRLFVREGQMVTSGQPIATISVEQPLLQGASPNDNRMIAISDQEKMLDGETTEENKRAQEEHTRLGALLDQSLLERGSLQSQLEIQKAAVISSKEVYDGLLNLSEKQLVTKSTLEARHQDYLSASQGISSIIQKLAELDEKIGETRSGLDELPTTHSEKLYQINANKEALEERKVDDQNSQGYLIRAPLSGRVTSVQIRTGEYVDQRLPLLSVVPPAAPLDATLFAPSRAVGLAKVGQIVRISYDAFPVDRFGSFPGRIESISKTILAPSEADAPFKLDEPVYRVAVQLQDQSVPAFGAPQRLQAGMTLKARIVLDQRSFLDWLLEPLEAVEKRS
jgi:membrane fusion protein